ncbi:hypothetical protein STRIC_2463 [Streptococcus ictaluri 707-05]|uniref:Uncharacterized protein n=1 Tax=Streptococcus ictaluri 707-05 TaxID=764299 RepID=G5K255_9STRE|nr:hypothetical protein STRIC_2463 [Streptococcus ictaluri 707-05]
MLLKTKDKNRSIFTLALIVDKFIIDNDRLIYLAWLVENVVENSLKKISRKADFILLKKE